MSYTFADFLGLMLISWFIITALHFLIGGIFSLFFREKDFIKIGFKK
jgi:hypothetical protein